jgi:hypothetical protein
VKIEYSSYLRTTPDRRKWVFGVPIIWVFGILFVLIPTSGKLNPSGIWAPTLIILLSGIFYTIMLYKKTGELYRFVRELRITREAKRRTHSAYSTSRKLAVNDSEQNREGIIHKK